MRKTGVTDRLSWFGNGGNGGVISTADELFTIMRAIVSGRLLSAELVSAMKRPNHESYGLGLGTYGLSCGTFYGHGGAVLGTGSIALVSDDGQDGVVIAVNVLSARDPQLPSIADRLVCPAD